MSHPTWSSGGNWNSSTLHKHPKAPPVYSDPGIQNPATQMQYGRGVKTSGFSSPRLRRMASIDNDTNTVVRTEATKKGTSSSSQHGARSSERQPRSNNPESSRSREMSSDRQSRRNGPESSRSRGINSDRQPRRNSPESSRSTGLSSDRQPRRNNLESSRSRGMSSDRQPRRNSPESSWSRGMSSERQPRRNSPESSQSRGISSDRQSRRNNPDSSRGRGMSSDRQPRRNSPETSWSRQVSSDRQPRSRSPKLNYERGGSPTSTPRESRSRNADSESPSSNHGFHSHAAAAESCVNHASEKSDYRYRDNDTSQIESRAGKLRVHGGGRLSDMQSTKEHQLQSVEEKYASSPVSYKSENETESSASSKNRNYPPIHLSLLPDKNKRALLLQKRVDKTSAITADISHESDNLSSPSSMDLGGSSDNNSSTSSRNILNGCRIDMPNSSKYKVKYALYGFYAQSHLIIHVQLIF